MNKWTEFNKNCDLLDVMPELSFIDLLIYYELERETGLLANFYLSYC